ncbi:MAG: hypothetical protein WC655_18415 [Candidatus Hydrogenedentales bacterium]|jgi:tetratricopeptide (TPR) repeat protein
MHSAVLRGVVVVLCAVSLSVSHACGPYFPNSYLVFGQEYTILDLPEASFYHGVSRALGKRPKMEDSWAEGYKTEWERTLDADVADLEEVLKANGVDDAKRADLTAKYLDMRTSMTSPPFEDASDAVVSDATKADVDSKYYERRDDEARSADMTGSSTPEPATTDSTESTEPADSTEPAGGEDVYGVVPGEMPQQSIDLKPYSELLAAIPREFSFYVKGAAAYRTGDTETAEKAWNDVLALPEKERHYRTTWATYMLGKIAEGTDLDKAKAYYEQVRTLAQNGFRDSLNLAPYSNGSLASNEFGAGNYVTALKLYADMVTNGPDHEQFIGYNSLRIVCDEVCSKDVIDKAVAADPLCRQIVSAWVASHPSSPELSASWNKAIADAGVTGVLPDADRLAWAAYSAGDMDTAKKWVDAAAPDALYAKWVHSKLLMRDGKIDDAIAILGELAKAFPASERWVHQDSELAYLEDESPESDQMLYDAMTERTSAVSEVRAELGVLLLGRGDYLNAFDTLVHSGYWMDAAYIAERVLTIDELAAYVTDHAGDKELQLQGQPSYSGDGRISRFDMIRYVLARRYMHAGKFEEAIANYPADLKPDAEKLAAELTASSKPRPVGWSEWLSTSLDDWWNKKYTRFYDRPRAEHFYAAAEIVRAKGMELMGTELEPDWTYLSGNFELDGPTYHRAYDEAKTATLEYPWSEGDDQSIIEQVSPNFKQAIQATADEKKRVWDHAPTPNKRFHYRYSAADLMWQCAAQLPGNDPMTLRALYWGGTYLKHRDPEAADRFYKAMVRRNWRMPFAQMADKMRWFPEQEPDENGNAIPIATPDQAGTQEPAEEMEDAGASDESAESEQAEEMQDVGASDESVESEQAEDTGESEGAGEAQP